MAALPRWLYYQGGYSLKILLSATDACVTVMRPESSDVSVMCVRVVSAGQRVSAAGPGMSLILVAIIAIAVILVIVGIIIVVVTTRRWASSKDSVFV